MKQYKEFIIKTNPFLPDIISGFLWELNISGINEEEDSLKIFSGDTGSISKEEIKDQLEKLVNNNIIISFEIEEHTNEYKNWNEEWEKGINAIEISDRIAVKPSFKNYENRNNKIVITIDPKMSFGTGEHQTTKLVIQLIEKYLKKGMRVLDIGTGTGILAIASIKLGADSAVAIDNDEWCFENIKENCKQNNVSDKIDIKICTIEQIHEKKFDLILANIQKNVLLEISLELIKKLAVKGIVILSGLLIEDESYIIERYKSLKLIERKTMGEWLALVLQNEFVD